MALTEAELLAQIAALETALLREEKSVQMADRLTTYRSFDEIRDTLSYLKTQLSVTRQRPRQFAVVTSKGLGC